MKDRSHATTETVSNLIELFSGLPGIGPKSAQRLAFFLLRAPAEHSRRLAEAIIAVKEKTRLCSCCFNIADADTCPICASTKRETSSICVVEQPQDIPALEHTGVFKGLYHVLHGAISPTEGVGTKDLRINELMERLKNGAIDEVIRGDDYRCPK